MPLTKEIPAQFGRYRILKKLGAGGMGVVYLAEDAQLKRRIALKVPHFDVADSPTTIERFFREARAAAQIDHQNICPIYDIGEFQGIHYLTMPYIEGHPLSHLVGPTRPMPPRAAVNLVRRLALVLDVMHQHGIIHRDLKPGNILMRPDGAPVIMDFGLARFVTGVATLTATGSAVGTPAYMSPQQIRADKAIGPDTDIYSLGVILYQLITGQLPFMGPLQAVYGQILFGDLNPPSTVRPGIDTRLDAICLKAMAREVQDRYASMTELARALDDYLAGGGAVSAPKAICPSPPAAVHVSSAETWIPRPDLATQVTAAGLGPQRAPGGSWFRRSLPGLMLTVLSVALAGAVMFISLRPEAPERDEGKWDARAEPASREGLKKPPQESEKAGREKALEVTPMSVEPVSAKKPMKEPDLSRSFLNSIGMQFVLVPQGSFWMSQAGRNAQLPVDIPQDFYLGVYEVTQEQWCAVMGRNPSWFSRSGNLGQAVTDLAEADLRQFPVEGVSWDDVQVFLRKLNEREHDRKWQYRLPREEEWEYACRGAVSSQKECSFDFYFDRPTNTLFTPQANFAGLQPPGSFLKDKYLQRPTRVGSYDPNRLGLYDLHGNVWEWCLASSPDDSTCVLRGGGWSSRDWSCRASSRDVTTRTDRKGYIGFRVARVPVAK